MNVSAITGAVGPQSIVGGYQVSTSWSVVGVGDFAGAGAGDILWRDTNGNLAMWFMNGAGAITSSVSLGNVP